MEIPRCVYHLILMHKKIGGKVPFLVNGNTKRNTPVTKYKPLRVTCRTRLQVTIGRLYSV